MNRPAKSLDEANDRILQLEIALLNVLSDANSVDEMVLTVDTVDDIRSALALNPGLMASLDLDPENDSHWPKALPSRIAEEFATRMKEIDSQ